MHIRRSTGARISATGKERCFESAQQAYSRGKASSCYKINLVSREQVITIRRVPWTCPRIAYVPYRWCTLGNAAGAGSFVVFGRSFSWR
jgi:hypothetical protein